LFLFLQKFSVFTVSLTTASDQLVSTDMAPSETVNDAPRTAPYGHTLKKQAHSTLIKPPLPNPSLQATADQTLKQVEAPVFAPGEGEVLLQIKATGICGYADRLGK